MIIEAKNLGKRFRKEWVFRNFSFNFSNNTANAIIGANGSGKSTLLQILTGYIPSSEGTVSYIITPSAKHLASKPILTDHIYKHISIAAPYLELVEEYTLKEMLRFHFSFKKMRDEISVNELINILYLSEHEDKYVKDFSSGMKQRLKLGLAFYTDSPITYLDEPTANLDKRGIDWYLVEINKVVNKRLIFVASNQEYEYHFCKNIIDVEKYKSLPKTYM